MCVCVCVRLYDQADVNLAGFSSQLEAPWMSSHSEEL